MAEVLHSTTPGDERAGSHGKIDDPRTDVTRDRPSAELAAPCREPAERAIHGRGRALGRTDERMRKGSAE